MRRGVESQIIIRLLGGLGVAGAQDELVGFGLCEELLDQLEALHTQVEYQLVSHLLFDMIAQRVTKNKGKQTRPEEAPVATTVFAARLAMLVWDFLLFFQNRSQ